MRRISLFLAIVVYAIPVLGGAYPIQVRGGDERSFTPPVTGTPTDDGKRHDVVVIGGGLAGLTAALYLSDQGRSVLLLEKESRLGGLAAGGALSSGIRYDRGASYWTRAYEEELEILKRIGLGDYDQRFAIPEPIDSYLWNGKLYEGVWEPETVAHLPASFAVFKHELEHADKDGLIPNQPIEEATKLDLDGLSASDWIRQMPASLAKRESKESQEIYRRFLTDTRLDPADPMKDVIHFVNLFSRSALGTTTDKLSGVSFANFYISEIETRYTSDIGTGTVAENLERILRRRPKLVRLVTEAAVGKVRNQGKQVEVHYVRDGKLRRSRASYAVFAAQLKFAPKAIEGFAAAEPERTRLIESIPFTHYSVHAVFVKGHPYRATYDTWTRAQDYTDEDFTDVINGRWMDPKIRGYEGMRDFSKEPADDEGLLTLYHPLTPRWVGTGYTSEKAAQAAETAVERMLELYSPLLAQRWGTRIDVKSVETNRWPFSIHVTQPGFFLNSARTLRKPFRRVFFAHSNLGTPAFEEALFRGHCAANNILKRMLKRFVQEAWSRCPLE